MPCRDRDFATAQLARPEFCNYFRVLCAVPGANHTDGDAAVPLLPSPDGARSKRSANPDSSEVLRSGAGGLYYFDGGVDIAERSADLYARYLVFYLGYRLYGDLDAFGSLGLL